MTNPLKKVPKTYAVEVDRPLRPDHRKLMESTFFLNDGTILKPGKVCVDTTNLSGFRITILEGKNRQIRRVCEKLGYQVRRLCRVSIGLICLGALREGELRPLAEVELASLMSVLST